MGEIKVSLLLQGRIVGADDGRDGFDVEEEVLVHFGYLGLADGHFVVREKIQTTMSLLTESL